jgi:hypothetical protein
VIYTEKQLKDRVSFIRKAKALGRNINWIAAKMGVCQEVIYMRAKEHPVIMQSPAWYNLEILRLIDERHY